MTFSSLQMATTSKKPSKIMHKNDLPSEAMERTRDATQQGESLPGANLGSLHRPSPNT